MSMGIDSTPARPSSSPAAPPASASASAAPSPMRAPGHRHRRDRRPKSTPRAADPACRFRSLDVRDADAVSGLRRRPRRPRRPGQLRRRQPARGRVHDPEVFADRPRHQPQRHDARLRSPSATALAAQRRRHPQHRLDVLLLRRAACAGLCGQQGRRRPAHQVAGRSPMPPRASASTRSPPAGSRRR